MTESEPLERNVKTAEGALKQEKAQVEAEKSLARERTAKDQRELDELQRRAQVYRRADLRPRCWRPTRGCARCGGDRRRGSRGRPLLQCHMSLRPQFFQDLKRGEQVMHCESCNRILYYNPPETFEQLAGETAPAARG